MSAKRDAAPIVGIGVAACAACCAGPILGFIAALGLGAVASVALFGTLGLAIALVVGTILVRRRRERVACAVPTVTESVVEMSPARVRTPG